MLIEVLVEGHTPLLFHRMTEAEMLSLPPFGHKTKLKGAPKVEKTPRELAECRLYVHEGNYVIPSVYFSSAFKNAASEYKMSDSSRKSMKSIAMAIFKPVDPFIPILDSEENLHKQWEVDIKVAKNHLKGAVVSVRPRFDSWKARFKVNIDSDLISENTAQKILEDAGRKVGIGSYRINCSGNFGSFVIRSWKKF